MRGAHLVEERREPRAAAARRVVGRRIAARRGSGRMAVVRASGMRGMRQNRSTRPRPIPLPTGHRPRAHRCHSRCHRRIPDLEVRSRARRANAATRKPPLLFVHGGYCDAWCWEPYFLPWFARQGLARLRAVACAATATSGGARHRCSSPGSTTTSPTSSTSPAQLRRAAGPDRPFDGRGDRRAAAGDAPGARRGAARAGAAAGLLPVAARLAAEHPDYAAADGAARPDRGCPTARARRRCGRSTSASDVDPRSCCARPPRHLARRVAARAVRPVAAAALGAAGARRRRRCSCWARDGDRICTPDDVARDRAPPRRRGRRSCPGSRHMLMLEPEWKDAAEAIAALAASLRLHEGLARRRGGVSGVRDRGASVAHEARSASAGSGLLDPEALEAVAAAPSRNSSCSRVPTPSATTLSPRPRARPMIASVIAASCGSVSRSAMNEMSIFSVSIGKCFRCVSDE